MHIRGIYIHALVLRACMGLTCQRNLHCSGLSALHACAWRTTALQWSECDSSYEQNRTNELTLPDQASSFTYVQRGNTGINGNRSDHPWCCRMYIVALRTRVPELTLTLEAIGSWYLYTLFFWRFVSTHLEKKNSDYTSNSSYLYMFFSKWPMMFV
jgi:hypothetical protein